MDEIKIKALIDAADSAKTIQELKKALRDLKSAAVEVGEGSKYFEQITAAAGGVSDRIGDLNAQVKNLGDDLFKLRGAIQIGQGIAAGFSIAQGAAALFGSENEAVEQSIMKVQAAMGILQGVQAVGEILQKETAATLLLQNTYRAIKVALLGEEAAATATATTATAASAAASTADATAKAAEATATGAATVAQEGLNTAMKANPVMLVVGAIVAAVAALAAFASGNKEAAEAQKALNKSLNDMRLNAELETKAFQGAIAALKEMKTGSVEREIAIKNINAQYGTTLKNLTDEKDFLKQVNLEVLNYTAYAKARLTVKLNEARAENYMKQAQEERYKITQKQRDLDLIRQKQQSYINSGNLAAAEQFRQQADYIQSEINGIKKVALGYEAKAEKVLKINGDLLSKESAAQEAARKKEEADEAARLKREEEQRRKALAKKVADNKKTNDKLLSDQEKFVQDYTDVEKEIYQVNVDIAEQNTILLGDTLEARLKAIQDAAQQEIDAENQKYAELLAKHVDVEKKKNEAEVAAKVKGVKKKTDAEITAEVEKNDKLIALKKAMGEREALITKNSQVEMAKITEEEEKRRQENIKKLTEQSLNTDEYRRFMDYLSLVRQGASFTKKELKDLREYLKDTVVKGTEAVPGLDQKVTKDLMVGIERDKALLKKDIKDLEKLIEDNKENVSLDAWVQAQRESLKKLEDQYDEIDKFGPQIERFINQFKIPQGQVVDYQNALKQITDANKDYRRSAESVLMPDQISAQLDRLFAFNRKIVGKERRMSKEEQEDMLESQKKTLTQLVVIYKNKYDTIAKSEQKITEQLRLEFDKRKDEMGKSLTDFAGGDNAQGAVINSLTGLDLQTIEEHMQKKFGALGPIYVRELKKMVDKAQEDAKRQGVEFDLMKFLGVGSPSAAPVEVKAPAFKVQPNPKKSEIGFEDIVKIDTEGMKTATEGLLTDLKSQYDKTVAAENSSYEAYLYGIFRKQEQELMLAGNNENKKKKIKEKYAQEVEVAEMNHQENLLGIDVAFGIKGQSELEKQQERKAQYMARKRKEELDERFAIMDKIVSLEKQAADILMQYLNEGYAEQDRMSQDRYDKKIALIDAEKKAYDDSIANRTAAEQQALDIEEEYALRKQQAEDERKREQNEIAKKQFEANRNNAIAQVVIDYGVAIAKAFMTFGWPAALIPSAWLTAQSALQVGLIASQDFVPTFATGGLVTGPGGPKDDKIPAMLSNGEVVINAKSSKMYAPILSAINEAGGGVPIPNIGASKADEIMMAAEGGVAEFTPSDRKNTPIVYGFSAPLVVGLDKTTMSELNQIMKSKDQTVSIQENTISNAQDKKAKVDSRTKF